MTFLVGFAVMCSALTSVAAASRAFSGYFQELAVVPLVVLVPLFILGLAYINFRGVAESVKLNVVMTCVELAGLLIVILIGAWALSQGIGEPARALEFNAGAEPFSLVVSGAALAFFAIIGFEDSVNMVEETTNPQRDFPRAFFIGITITGIVYMLVAFFTTALVPIDVLRDTDQDLLEVVRAGAPWFPLVLFSFIAMVAVGNTSLINLMMSSRLLYGMAERAGDPADMRHRARTAAHAVGRDHHHDVDRVAARELERRTHARRHDGATAALRFRGRERCRAGAAQRRRSSTPTTARRRSVPFSAWFRACTLHRRSRAARPRSTSSPACCCSSASACS